MSFDDEETTFTVLINHEEQYSLWPAEKSVPNGWRVADIKGSKAECLKFVEANWQDMRPLSLRQKQSYHASD